MPVPSRRLTALLRAAVVSTVAASLLWVAYLVLDAPRPAAMAPTEPNLAANGLRGPRTTR